ncbi:MAG: hypothetical protein KIT69_16335, partial [Propionibacteriaceae bacterium]|nr:hypothetical protein [Propionibacteriaceae bacterium]
MSELPTELIYKIIYKLYLKPIQKKNICYNKYLGGLQLTVLYDKFAYNIDYSLNKEINYDKLSKIKHIHFQPKSNNVELLYKFYSVFSNFK